MSYLDRQLAGKYKGVSFFVRNETLNNVGQSRVKHKYPKTGVQYMEPMGREPFTETIDLFFAGENFREDFEKFKKAIQDPAPGRLFSPTYGVFNSIVAEPSSFTSEQTALGEITASVVFSETIDRPSPTEAAISEQDVSEKSQEARSELQDQFENDYAEPASVNNIKTASFDAKSLADRINDITKATRAVNRFLRSVDQKIRNASAYASLLLNPGQPEGFLQSLAVGLSGAAVFTLYQNIATLGNDLTNSVNDILADISPKKSTATPQAEPEVGIDTSIALWDDDTFERQQRNQGRLAVVNTFRLTGLIGMFETAASQDYTTTDEIDKVTATLDEYYDSLIDDDETEVVIPGMKTILDELKNLTDSVLARKRQQAYTVIEIKLYIPTSSYLLAYNLYGEYLKTVPQLEFMSDLIAGLNRSQPSYRLIDTIKVVEVGR